MPLLPTLPTTTTLLNFSTKFYKNHSVGNLINLPVAFEASVRSVARIGRSAYFGGRLAAETVLDFIDARKEADFRKKNPVEYAPIHEEAGEARGPKLRVPTYWRRESKAGAYSQKFYKELYKLGQDLANVAIHGIGVVTPIGGLVISVGIGFHQVSPVLGAVNENGQLRQRELREEQNKYYVVRVAKLVTEIAKFILAGALVRLAKVTPLVESKIVQWAVAIIACTAPLYFTDAPLRSWFVVKWA
jgi:hypothetical protein